MSFLHIGHFSQHCPAHHNASPNFAEVCFRFVQTIVFLVNFFLLHNLSHQTFINAYNLYFVLVHNIYVTHENVEPIPVLASVFCYLLRFLENQT